MTPEQLARKWCPAEHKSYGTAYPDLCACTAIAGATRETLEAAEQIAETWGMQIDNLLPCLFAARISGDMSDVGLLTGKGIAVAIAALKGADRDANP